MAASRFCRYELRTTEPEAARAFYMEVIGPSFWGRPHVGCIRLPERAAARGAPAHWLGHIGVGDVRDVEAAVRRLVALGAEPLGPSQREEDGTVVAVLRDPFGAVVALSSSAPPPDAPVVWHLLHTEDRERAWAVYSELFGWTATGMLDVGQETGPHQTFAWDDSGASVGGMASTAQASHVHRHWLFHFHVGDLDEAVLKVRALGGTASKEAIRLANGEGVAVCEDAQGAAFALQGPSAHDAGYPIVA